MTIKRMFGGLGIYRDGLFFALVADGVLYLKVDEENRAAFEAAGGAPFVYEGQSKPMTMSYFTPPEEIMDDDEALREWAELGFQAAVRAAAAKAKPRGRKRGSAP